MEKILNHINLKKYLIECENILIISKNNNVFKLLNEFKIEINIIDGNNNLDNINIDYNICFVDSMYNDLNKLSKIIKKYIILFGIENNENIKSFMESNDDWIYNNDDWTFENNMVIIKKKEENEKNIICVIKENAFFYNPKSFELFDYYFNLNYKMVKKNINTINNFIEEKNKINNIIVFIYDTILNEFDYFVLKYIQEHKKIDCKIFILTQDWWVASKLKHIKEKHFKKDILKTNNYNLIINVDNVEMLFDFNDINCLEYKSNIICFNYWGIYKSSIMNFNVNPIKKIMISGCLDRYCYYERQHLKYLNNKYIYVYEYNNNDISGCIKNNNFSMELNKYLCCFSSSIHVANIKYKKMMNTHIILLKTFEILASGSLLIVPDYEEFYLKKIGLIKGEHYLTLNFNENLNEQINNLFNESNISNINNIRLCGYNHAINNLTNKQKFIEMNEIFTKS